MNSPRIKDIAAMVHLIEDEYVLFADDLARIYGMSLRDLEDVIEHHPDRFPGDFVLRLSPERTAVRQGPLLRARPGTRLAFTQAGICMIGSVFESEPIAQWNIAIIRAIVKRRHFDGLGVLHDADLLH